MTLNCIICGKSCEVKDPRAKIKLCDSCNTSKNIDTLKQLVASGKSPEQITSSDFGSQYQGVVNEYGELV